MNPVDGYNRFWDLIPIWKPKFSTGLLYFFLLSESVDKDEASLILSDSLVSKSLNMSRSTIRISRIELEKMGLIEFTGTRGVAINYILKAIDNFNNANEEQKVNEKTTKEIKTKNSENNDSTPPSLSKNPNPPVEKEVIPQANTPQYEEILEYARTIDGFNQSLEFSLRAKYDFWVTNGWKTGHGKKINNWQVLVRSSLPYLKEFPNEKQTGILPTINRPRDTYNE